MTAISKTTTTYLPATRAETSTLVQTVKAVFTSALRRWMIVRNRRQLMRISELDDYLLRDIGLHRGDVYTATHYRGRENPTRVLRSLADAQRRIEATRHIC